MCHFAERGQFTVTGVLSIVIGQEIQQKRGGEEEQELQFLGLKVTFFFIDVSWVRRLHLVTNEGGQTRPHSAEWCLKSPATGQQREVLHAIRDKAYHEKAGCSVKMWVVTKRNANTWA